jgi:hypothetical protein
MIDQWNKIKSPEISPYIYSRLVFARESMPINGRKNSLFSKWCSDDAVPNIMKKRMKLDHHLTPYTKTNLKRSKDKNTGAKSMKL